MGSSRRLKLNIQVQSYDHQNISSVRKNCLIQLTLVVVGGFALGEHGIASLHATESRRVSCSRPTRTDLIRLIRTVRLAPWL